MSDGVKVAVGVILDSSGQQVLLAKRPAHVHQGGLWEFPGGKVEPGETVAHALVRELGEEVGIEPVNSQPLLDVSHDYGDKRVLLNVWLISEFIGQPCANEGQTLCWVAIEQLHNIALPAANSAIVARLQAATRQ